jgi:hypothetical protein
VNNFFARFTMLIPILSILTPLIDIALVAALEQVDTKAMSRLTETTFNYIDTIYSIS